MSGIREKKCPMCGNSILDLGLSGDEDALCFACYRKVAADKKEAQEA
ncbi:MAG: zinc finger domain-containing protein [bacterium]